MSKTRNADALNDEVETLETEAPELLRKKAALALLADKASQNSADSRVLKRHVAYALPAAVFGASAGFASLAIPGASGGFVGLVLGWGLGLAAIRAGSILRSRAVDRRNIAETFILVGLMHAILYAIGTPFSSIAGVTLTTGMLFLVGYITRVNAFAPVTLNQELAGMEKSVAREEAAFSRKLASLRERLDEQLKTVEQKAGLSFPSE